MAEGQLDGVRDGTLGLLQATHIVPCHVRHLGRADGGAGAAASALEGVI